MTIIFSLPTMSPTRPRMGVAIAATEQVAGEQPGGPGCRGVQGVLEQRDGRKDERLQQAERARRNGQDHERGAVAEAPAAHRVGLGGGIIIGIDHSGYRA